MCQSVSFTGFANHRASFFQEKRLWPSSKRPNKRKLGREDIENQAEGEKKRPWEHYQNRSINSFPVIFFSLCCPMIFLKLYVGISFPKRKSPQFVMFVQAGVYEEVNCFSFLLLSLLLPWESKLWAGKGSQRSPAPVVRPAHPSRLKLLRATGPEKLDRARGC